MPPSNSPSHTPSSPSDPPFIRQLRSGVPFHDLVRTFTPGDENTQWLDRLASYRSHSGESSSNRHSENPARSSWFAGDGTRSMSSEERVLRRSVLSTRHRYMQRLIESRPPREHAYSERAPSYHPSQQQSIYDWAPAMSDEDDASDSSRLRDYQMRLLLEEQNYLRASRHPFGLNSSSSSTSPSASASNSTPGSGSRYRLLGNTQAADQDSTQPNSESSLRSLAFMQSIRRHPRVSTRNNRPSNHPTYMERERSFQDSTGTSEAPPRPPTRFNSGEEPTRLRGLEAAMQRHLTGRSATGSSSLYQPRWLVEAINYLDGIRLTETAREARAAATARGFFCSEFCADSTPDILMDVTHLQPIPESSWLRVGSCFEGSQYTHPTGAGRSRAGRSEELSNSDRQSSHLDLSKQLPDDKWRVKVTVHSIDYNTMKLTGTMEAMNVPDRLSETGSTSILTYLEGEIVDLKEHSLKTVNFRSEPDIDAEYWRRLEPFVGKNELTIARNVLSPGWLADDLRENWILMRWKERCFIKPAADHHRGTLSISGFYYVSMRRSTGAIEGFYFDYDISPFQHLSLRPSQQSFPSYEFR